MKPDVWDDGRPKTGVVRRPKTTAVTVAGLSAAGSAAGIGAALRHGIHRIFGRHTPLVDRFAFWVVIGLIVLSVIGPVIAPYPPFSVDTAATFLPPGAAHLFGTDDLGRDVLSRLLSGAGLTLLSSLAIVLASTILGIIVAGIASMVPRWLDDVIMRICDIFMSIPQLVLALGVAAVLGPSLGSIIIAMIVSSWAPIARMMRGILRETLERSYIEASRILGVSHLRLMLRHGLPNSLDAIYVQASMAVSGTIVLISGLAFLGVGAPPPSPDWGSMIAEGQQYMTSAWWISLFPGIAITVAAIAFGLVGDAVRSMVDPSARRA